MEWKPGLMQLFVVSFTRQPIKKIANEHEQHCLQAQLSILPPPTERGNVFTFVDLSICGQDNTTFWTNVPEIFGWMVIFFELLRCCHELNVQTSSPSSYTFQKLQSFSHHIYAHIAVNVYIAVNVHVSGPMQHSILESSDYLYFQCYTDHSLKSVFQGSHASLKVLEFSKSNCAISATSSNNICIGLECIIPYLLTNNIDWATSFDLPGILPKTGFANTFFVFSN